MLQGMVAPVSQRVMGVCGISGRSSDDTHVVDKLGLYDIASPSLIRVRVSSLRTAIKLQGGIDIRVGLIQ